MKPFILLLLTLIAFSGCSDRPVITDNATVVVQPGVGISNICALGMTYEEIRRATRDVVLLNVEARSWRRLIPWRKRTPLAVIPSLAVQAQFSEDATNIWMLFYVAPSPSNKTPFRGKLGESLSFKDGPVSKAQVEAAFGKATRTNAFVYQFSPSFDPMTSSQFRLGNDSESLHYPAKGISFILRSNHVVHFTIERLVTPRK